MTALKREVEGRVERLALPWNRYGFDPYGVSKRDLSRFFTAGAFAYRHYFRVHNHGVEHVPKAGRAMLIGNHSGGVALDAGIVILSLFLEMDPPRLAQGMVEKFLGRTPYASKWLNRGGQFLGLPETAIRLLEDERLLLVFPEGARGTAKLYRERHSLVDFGTGFMRLALQTKTPIVPFAFLGGGDAIPTVFNSYGLGRLLGAPYVPFTPYLLPVPLPARLDVLYGDPIVFEGTGAEEDHVIASYVARVKEAIAGLIGRGLDLRGDLRAPREKQP